MHALKAGSRVEIRKDISMPCVRIFELRSSITRKLFRMAVVGWHPNMFLPSLPPSKQQTYIPTRRRWLAVSDCALARSLARCHPPTAERKYDSEAWQLARQLAIARSRLVLSSVAGWHETPCLAFLPSFLHRVIQYPDGRAIQG